MPTRAGGVLAAFLLLIAIAVAIWWWTRPTTVSIPDGDTPHALEIPAAGSDADSGDSDLRGADPVDPAEPADVVVHVTGAVESPGVHTLGGGSRVDDAISAAGGFTGDADESSLNRAEVLLDGQQIYVPEIGEEPRAQVDGGGSQPDDGTVNINTASAQQLEALPGIGPALAARIVSHRESHGLFSSAEDLTSVSGIGERKLEAMIDMVTW